MIDVLKIFDSQTQKRTMKLIIEVEVNNGLKCSQFYDNPEKIYKYIGKCTKK